MAILGLRGTGDWGAEERPQNFREMILWRDPNGDSPIFALMAKMRKETTDDPQFHWWEEEQNPLRIAVNAAATTGDGTLTVDATEYDAFNLVANDVFLVEKLEDTGYTHELVEVSANPTASNQFTVTRGVAGSTADSIAAGTFLTKIGTAFGEGSTAPQATTRNPTKFTNYTQIFQTTYKITGTADETRARTGDALKNDKKRRSFDHSSSIEFAIMWGKPHETTDSSGEQKRYTGGLYHFLSEAFANGSTHCIQIWTTTPSEDEFLNAVYKVWDYQSAGAGNERLVLAGNGFLNALNKIVKNSSSTQINFDSTIKLWGMDLRRVILPQGTLFVRTHPLMNTHGRFNQGAFILNPAGMRWRPLRGRDTKPKDSIQPNDADYKAGQWITEAGCEFNHLNTMAYLRLPA